MGYEEEVNLMAVWFSRGDNKFPRGSDPTGSKVLLKEYTQTSYWWGSYCITALIHELYELASEAESS